MRSADERLIFEALHEDMLLAMLRTSSGVLYVMDDPSVIGDTVPKEGKLH